MMKTGFARRTMDPMLCALCTVLASFIFVHPVDAQEAKAVPRIGLLSVGSPPQNWAKSFWRGLEQGFRDHGYVEGKNIVIEWRWALGKRNRLPGLVNELLAKKVDVIVTVSTPAAFAVRRATSTIPVVMAVASASAVVPALVKSLARPGGNVTGMVSISQALTAKRLELAKEIIPSASRIAILGSKRHPGFTRAVNAAKAAAKVHGVSIVTFGIKTVGKIDKILRQLGKARIDAVVVPPSGVVGSLQTRLVNYFLKTRMPAILPARHYAKLGGLVGYGTDNAYQMRRAVSFVDKILKGAKPADLPVEQATRFDLAINLKTAKTLGLTIPPAVLLRATEVIE